MSNIQSHRSANAIEKPLTGRNRVNLALLRISLDVLPSPAAVRVGFVAQDLQENRPAQLGHNFVVGLLARGFGDRAGAIIGRVD